MDMKKMTKELELFKKWFGYSLGPLSLIPATHKPERYVEKLILSENDPIFIVRYNSDYPTLYFIPDKHHLEWEEYVKTKKQVNK
jgi:hypothetical protein